jgi:hypothetical protein
MLAQTSAVAQAREPAAVHAWSFDLERSRPFAPPYVASFEQRGRRLTYVAARHVAVRDQEDVLLHPTLRTLRSLFERQTFDLVLTEGLVPGQEASPSLLDKALDCQQRAYRSDCGEAFFLLNAAREHGTSVRSVEPAPREIRDRVLAVGFSGEDLLGYYLLRQIPQMRRQATLAPSRFRVEAQLLLDRWRRSLGITEPFPLERFEAWYRRHMGAPANYLDVSADDSAPHGGADAHHVQRVSAAVNLVRDQAAVRTVQAALQDHSHILLVMGSSHLLTQLPALQALLGEARFGKPY